MALIGEGVVSDLLGYGIVVNSGLLGGNNDKLAAVLEKQDAKLDKLIDSTTAIANRLTNAEKDIAGLERRLTALERKSRNQPAKQTNGTQGTSTS